jgi:hypothetical protein
MRRGNAHLHRRCIEACRVTCFAASVRAPGTLPHSLPHRPRYTTINSLTCVIGCSQRDGSKTS